MNLKEPPKFDFDQPEGNDPFKLNEEPQFLFGNLESQTVNLEEIPEFSTSSKDDTLFDLNKSSEFVFDNPLPDLMNVDNEIIDLSDPVRCITCICPKCGKKTDIDLVQVPESGYTITCSSCKNKIQILKESGCCRARRRSYEINCASCGELLDQHAYCVFCGKLYPDYFITVNPDDARSKARKSFIYKKWAAIRDLKISFKDVTISKSQDFSKGYSPAARTGTSVSAISNRASRRPAIIAAFTIVAVLLIASGVFAYNSYKARQVYTENYIKALYCIKTGIDTNFQTCVSWNAEWGAASTSGKSFYPSINNKDDIKSIKLQGEIDKYMQKLADPPTSFLPANESLNKIHKIYLDSGAFVQSKPNSLQELGKSIDGFTKRMNQASQELKSTLPESIKVELTNAKLKYRGLQNF